MGASPTLTAVCPTADCYLWKSAQKKISNKLGLKEQHAVAGSAVMTTLSTSPFLHANMHLQSCLLLDMVPAAMLTNAHTTAPLVHMHLVYPPMGA